MIVYEKRAPLPLPFFSQCSNSEVYSNYTNIFSLAKGKIIFKNINPCLLYDTHTCNFLVFGNTFTQNGANICDLSLPTKVTF